MDFLQQVSTQPFLFLVAFVLLGESVIVFLTGFGSNNWFSLGVSTYGLWEFCKKIDYGYGRAGYTCESWTKYVEYDKDSASFWASRLIGFVSLACQVAAMVQLFVFVFKATKKWATGACSSCFAASVLAIISAVRFLTLEISDSALVSWSGVLVIIAALMQAHAGFCILYPIVRRQVHFVDQQHQVVGQGPVAGGQILGYQNQNYGAAPQYPGGVPPPQGAPGAYQGAPAQGQGVPVGYQAAAQGVPAGYQAGPPQGVTASYQGVPPQGAPGANQGVPPGHQGAPLNNPPEAQSQPNQTNGAPVPATE